jgi:MFS family permease
MLISPTLTASNSAYADVIRKVYRRIIPIVFLGYVISFLDRTILSFVSLEMNHDLNLSPTGYAFGAGLFFLSYICLEIPSNVILERVGARLWIARIMITWGIVTAASAFIVGQNSFYAMRFLLGMSEAGFFPGILLYMTYWFPSDHRAKTTALFTMALPVSVVIGGPLSSSMLALGQMGGMAPWRLTFIIAGVPAVLLGIYIWATMASKPQDAKWLTEDEKQLLIDRLRAEDHPNDVRHTRSFRAAIKDRRVLLLAVLHLFWAIGLYSATLWLPQVVKKLGVSNGQVGWLLAIPAILGAIAMIFWAAHSDRTKHRRRHAVIANIVGAIGLFGSALLRDPVLSMAAITVGMVGIYCYSAVFYPIPQTILRGTSAASGIAFITGFSNLAGFLGTYMVGWLNERFGNFTYALLALGASLLISAFLLGFVPHETELEEARR